MKLKKLFAIIISLCLLMTLAPLNALAEPAVVAEGDFSVAGEAYASVTWRVTDDGVLTIGGTGEMPNYYVRNSGSTTSYTNAPYYNYKDNITSLVFENGITKIGNYAFYRWSNLTGELKLSANLIKIGSGAFYDCAGFSGPLVIPDTLTEIGVGAFYSTSYGPKMQFSEIDCSSLEQWCAIDFLGDSSSNPLVWGHKLYINGELFTTFSLPAGQTEIKNNTFAGCTSLTGDLIIPDSVTKIGPDAFSWCRELNGTLTLGSANSRLQTIGDRAFQYCDKLTGDIVIPNTVTEIGAGAFSNCTALNGMLTLGGENSQLQTIGMQAFYQCRNLTGDLNIPAGVTSIGASAFYQCYGLTGALTLGGENIQLQTIGEQAFCSCTGLNGALTVGSSVQTVGNEAFKGCTNLTGKLTIQNPETVIGTCAFHGCAKNGDILAFFADHPEFIEVTQTAYTAPTVTSEGSETLKVCCADEVHTTESEKLIKTFTRSVPYIYINTITPTPAEVTLAVGKTAQIGTTVTPLDAMDPTVAFSSDDTNVVTVDNTGLLTAGNPGTATVTIVPADGSDHATATVNVTVYDLTVPEKIVVAVDGTASAAAVVDPDIAVTPERTYTSSDENIFTVDSEGNITPVAAGTATVTVTDGEITKTIPVTVVNATVSVDKDTLAKDETADISVTALPDGTAAVQSVSYVSSDETILTVSDAGVVTALKTGDATITVTASILAAGETVTVTKTLNFSVYTPVTSITATAEKTLLDMEDAPYTQITVEALPEEADIRNVIYTSSDPSVLDVDADGLVIALHQGTATVTITAADGYGAETTIDFTVTHDLYALHVGPTVEEEETGNATVETNTARRFTVRYTSSDPEILEVDPDTGAYTAKKKGTVTVTAELDFEDGGHKTLTQEIVVRDPHEGEFRCSRCDWYDDVKDAPGIRGVIYWMIHTITHFVQLINSMT